MLNRFSVINRLLARLQSHISFFPRGFAPFMTSAPRHLAEKICRANFVDFHLKNRFDRTLDFRLGRVTIDPKRQQLTPVLGLFFGHQSLLGNYRGLDNHPTTPHALRPPSSIPLYSSHL